MSDIQESHPIKGDAVTGSELDTTLPPEHYEVSPAVPPDCLAANPADTRLRPLSPEDRERAEQLFITHYGGLVRLAAHLGSADPEGAAQEVILRVSRRPEIDSVFSFLRRAMVNHTISEARAAQARPQTRSLPDALDRPSADMTPETLVVQGMLTQGLLARLRPEHRTVLELRYLQDLSVGDVARVLGLPEGTVKSQVHFALKRCRAMVAKADLAA